MLVFLILKPGLSARVYPDSVRAGDTVSLECRKSCQLPSVVWFKDGRLVAQPHFQAQAKHSGNYLCVVEGHESVLSDPVALDVQCKCVYYDVVGEETGQ